MSTSPSEEEPAPVELSEEEAAAVADVVVSYARAVPADRAQPYADLLEQIRTGTVTGAGLATLEQVCAIALETGQARRIGTAEVEGFVTAVYRRTPGGAIRMGQIRDINQALARLKGNELRNARVASQRPGRYTITLGVRGFELTLVVSQSGLEVSSLTTS